MSFNPEELQEILSIYKAESEEHLLKMNECLIRLEKRRTARISLRRYSAKPTA